MHIGILHDRKLAQCKTLADIVEVHDRRRFHPGYILVRYDGQHARRLFRWSRIDPTNFSFGDRTVDRHCIRHVLDLEFGREARLTLDLGLSVDAVKGLAHIVPMVNQRIYFLIGQSLRNRLHDALDHTHRTPPTSANSVNTLMIVRLANSILKSLWPYPRAPESSASAARAKVSRFAFAPSITFSALYARQGL